MRSLSTRAILCGVALVYVYAAAAPAFAAVNYNASKSNTVSINYNSSKSNTGKRTYNSSHSNTGNAAFKIGSTTSTSTVRPQWGVGRANKGALQTLQGTVQNLTSSSFTLACANGQHYTVSLAPKGKVVQKNHKNAVSLNFTKLHNNDSVSVTGLVNRTAISASSVIDNA